MPTIRRKKTRSGAAMLGRRFFTTIGLVAVAGVGTRAKAWDPSTTHLELTRRAFVDSPVHLRWMDASRLDRGVFSPLRVDPAKLPAERSFEIIDLQSRIHADSGAVALGGPGACPPASAPIDTQRHCVRGDLWELPAIGWLSLGVLAESRTANRLLHHFVDPSDPSANSWRADGLRPSRLRRLQSRNGGEPGAGVFTGTNFSGTSTSAHAWLHSSDDPLAPPRTFEHLARSIHANEPEDRQHALALGLMGVGALLHVAQDLGVPAHARGDLGAFLTPLSSASPRDRGLALQEYARRHPSLVRQAIRRGETDDGEVRPWPSGLGGHLIGESSIASLTASNFVSSGRNSQLGKGLDAHEAAMQLLGPQHGLAPAEVENARAEPWPASSGYVLSTGGRPLVAYRVDSEGNASTFLDEPCLREQLQQTLPRVASVSRSLLDGLWPAWPADDLRGEGDARRLVVTKPTPWRDVVAYVMSEDQRGERTALAQYRLRDGAPSALPLPASYTPSGDERIVVGLVGIGEGGLPFAIDRVVLPLGVGEP